MTDFEISRIVPSTRDFAGAVRTGGRGLALVPVLTGVAGEVERLDGLDVRALATREAGEACMRAARATAATPLALLAPARSVEACQRARFFGADAVALAAAELPSLEKTVRSMRMMPLAVIDDEAALAVAVASGARLLLLRGELELVCALAARRDKTTLTVAEVPGADATALAALVGVVDAALVPATVHESDSFEALLDELDG